jgi:hypothetical protein
LGGSRAVLAHSSGDGDAAPDRASSIGRRPRARRARRAAGTRRDVETDPVPAPRPAALSWPHWGHRIGHPRSSGRLERSDAVKGQQGLVSSSLTSRRSAHCPLANRVLRGAPQSLPRGRAHGTCNCRRPLDAAAVIWGDKGTWAILSRARAFFGVTKVPPPSIGATAGLGPGCFKTPKGRSLRGNMFPAELMLEATFRTQVRRARGHGSKSGLRSAGSDGDR